MYCIGHMMPRSPSQTWQISDIKVLLRIDGYNSRLCASSPSVVTHTPGLTGSWAPPCSMHLACKQFVAPNPLPKYVCVCRMAIHNNPRSHTTHDNAPSIMDSQTFIPSPPTHVFFFPRSSDNLAFSAITNAHL